MKTVFKNLTYFSLGLALLPSLSFGMEQSRPLFKNSYYIDIQQSKIQEEKENAELDNLEPEYATTPMISSNTKSLPTIGICSDPLHKYGPHSAKQD